MLKLYPQDRRLYLIKPAVESDKFMLICGPAPVISEELHFFVYCRVIGCYYAAVAVCPEILAWIKTEASRIADASNYCISVSCAKGLGAISNNLQIMLFCYLLYPIHIFRLPA